TDRTFTVTSAGIYSVRTDFNGCLASDSVVIGVMYKPVIHLIDTFLCKGEQILLDPHVAPTDNVIWQNTVTTHGYQITTPGTYMVYAFNKCGNDTKDITITEKLCKVIMPTAFTPNHDNKNDLFRLKYPELVKTFHLVIYNRMGQKVFETTNPY